MIVRAYSLECIAFLSGMIIMVLELIGVRILAPFLGASLYIWTGVIGSILLCLSIGYCWGGKLADTRVSFSILQTLLVAAAGALALLILIKTPFLNFIENEVNDMRVAGILAALFLFGPSTVLFAMVTPYIVKMKLTSVERTGQTVGNLYAVSTMGSIFGTFLTGFVLLSFFTTTKILFMLMAMAVSMSLLLGIVRYWTITLYFFVIAGFALSSIYDAHLNARGIVRAETPYQHIDIYETKISGDSRPVRVLSTGAGGYQSLMYIDDHFTLAADYYKYYTLANILSPDLKRVLMIGGGAYVYPNYFVREFPHATIDVVEIDPALKHFAKKYFVLSDTDRLRSFHEDGRAFLNKTNNIYDAVLVDAFTDNHAIPFQLTTIEAMRLIHQKLTDDGTLIMNIASAIEGNKGKFLRAELRTLQEVFPYIQVYAVTTQDPNIVQNIIVIARKKPILFPKTSTEIQILLQKEWTAEMLGDMPILTDDFAPVDQYARFLFL